MKMSALLRAVIVIVAVAGACLSVVGEALGIAILTKLGIIAAVAAVLGFSVQLIVLLTIPSPGKPPVPDVRLFTYLRSFFQTG